MRLVAAGAGLAVLGYGGGWLTTQWWAGGQPVQGPDDFSQRPDEWDPVWLTGASAHSGTTFEIAGSVGVAFLVIAVCLVAADRLPRVRFPLASVGAMALTAYVGTVVAAWMIGTIDYATNWPWIVYVVATLALATAWRLVFGRGPLERLLTWSSTRAAQSARPSPASAHRPSSP